MLDETIDPFFAVGVDLFVQLLLDILAFHHRLDDPVAVLEQLKVIFRIAGGDQLRVALGHERRGVGLEQLRHSTFGDGVAVGPGFGDDVEQHHGHARVGDMGGDPGAHDAGADHGGFFDLGHGQCPAQTASRMVAMP